MQSLRELYESRIPGVTVPVGQDKPKSQTWKRTTIEVTLAKHHDYARIPWSAYVKESLAVAHGVSSKLSPLPGWEITHIPSGCVVGSNYKTRVEAIEKAEQLLCIEGLWDNPVQNFRNGLSETDCTRINTILGTSFSPGEISSHLRGYFAHLDSQGGTHVQP
jgi:hypothetical protein